MLYKLIDLFFNLYYILIYQAFELSNVPKTLGVIYLSHNWTNIFHLSYSVFCKVKGILVLCQLSATLGIRVYCTRQFVDFFLIQSTVLNKKSLLEKCFKYSQNIAKMLRISFRLSKWIIFKVSYNNTVSHWNYIKYKRVSLRRWN